MRADVRLLRLLLCATMPWLDGVYGDNVKQAPRKPRLHRTRAPTSTQLTRLVGTIAHRACRHLVRKGGSKGEDESVFLPDSAGSDDGMGGLRMSSISYRIATGKYAGRKAVTLHAAWWRGPAAGSVNVKVVVASFMQPKAAYGRSA